jgi:hypothetical protein
MVNLGMGKREEFVEEAELVHQLKGRWVYSVAAKIAEKVGVLNPARVRRRLVGQSRQAWIEWGRGPIAADTAPKLTHY